jgi:hypothetical protein
VVEAERIEADALAVGAKFLSATQLEGIRWQVEDVTWKYPIRGVFQIESATRGFAQSEQWGAFDWVVAIPMSPFRALEGVDTGAQAIMQFNTTAGEFAATVAQLPELMRWQTELLLYDIEGRDTVRAGLAAFETLAASGARLSETAERLPADVRAQVASLLAEVEGRQAALGRTLADARALLADLDGSMARGGALAKVLTRLARQVDRTGATWQAVVAEVRGPERDATAAASRPFDILDYERTLGRLESASTELRGLAAALRDASGTLSGLLDAALWRLLLLLLAFFALRLAFRRLEHRLARRK